MNQTGVWVSKRNKLALAEQELVWIELHFLPRLLGDTNKDVADDLPLLLRVDDGKVKGSDGEIAHLGVRYHTPLDNLRWGGRARVGVVLHLHGNG